jgi:hypothetical protein
VHGDPSPRCGCSARCTASDRRHQAPVPLQRRANAPATPAAKHCPVAPLADAEPLPKTKETAVRTITAVLAATAAERAVKAL